MSSAEALRMVAELNEEIRFVREYIDEKLSPEVTEAIKEAQSKGEAKTVGEAFNIAKKAGWK